MNLTPSSAQAAVDRARALHCDNGTGWCPEEPFVRWPCNTARALDPALAPPAAGHDSPHRARLDKMSRALDRAHALVEQWTGDQTVVTRSEAADLFASVLELNGWEQTPAPPHLALVPGETP